ncbi:MAG: hypothetical protein JO043_10935 [Candidatus Eremiobacteraeota bacterium]|nr:hypothetical protein [Candidatus Eremiobacteraeota bacterium]
MKTTLRRIGLPALFLSGALVGGTLTGIVSAAQPHMQSALSYLYDARQQLQVALADKGGHRDRAINLVNSAISEVRSGMAYARMH